MRNSLRTHTPLFYQFVKSPSFFLSRRVSHVKTLFFHVDAQVHVFVSRKIKGSVRVLLAYLWGLTDI